ncbi:RRQRL motif-containing zinc-binding protein [Actinomadura rupiterrae]|uniref:RRQRL motif-containing zinc-binding protein n=1 Tax=Actinomadura rupiterrae TaxID=559627 RepID=UPI0020A3B636|nr:RRQRL motif-containing zinc-binding protein [Actinomadura rupiterrae]MCP2343382.1 hypothetical protein [Actinomadura rupiterrae]
MTRFYDPTGDKYGVPTYPWRMAPGHLLTRRQLTARGLRPGGQTVVAQVMWQSRRTRGVREAYLYDARLALPKRTASPRQRVALGKAMAARRTCPECRTDVGYVIPRSLGACLDCAESWENAA